MNKRRTGVLSVIGAMIVLIMVTVSWNRVEEQDLPRVTVYKSQWCGCCTQWVAHMRDNGFEADVVEINDLSSIKSRYGVSEQLSSCHTAVADGYVIEGHVPADLVKRLLRERPDVVGLTVPGMPVGSPGMEGSTKQPYDVLTFDRDGNTTVYARR